MAKKNSLKNCNEKIQKEKLTFWLFKPRDGATKLGHNYHTRAHKQANVLNILEMYHFQSFLLTH
jgi:hypothetical protein